MHMVVRPNTHGSKSNDVITYATAHPTYRHPGHAKVMWLKRDNKNRERHAGIVHAGIVNMMGLIST